MDKNDLKLAEKYICRHENDSFEVVEEEGELISFDGGSVVEGQSYHPGEPLAGGSTDPELVLVKVLSTGKREQVRACDLSPLV